MSSQTSSRRRSARLGAPRKAATPSQSNTRSRARHAKEFASSKRLRVEQRRELADQMSVIRYDRLGRIGGGAEAENMCLVLLVPDVSTLLMKSQNDTYSIDVDIQGVSERSKRLGVQHMERVTLYTSDDTSPVVNFLRTNRMTLRSARCCFIPTNNASVNEMLYETCQEAENL